MTERLYQHDCYQLKFESKVVAVDKIGEHYNVILEKTAFYPESGGQLADKGVLDGWQTVNIIENNDGEIIHMVPDWNAGPGQTVIGIIDNEWRLDNMRKHTGQHILSQAFIVTANAETVGSRLGEMESTIELLVSSMDDDMIQSVENLANDIIRQNMTVTINYYTRAELMKFPIRKIPEREGQFRVIRIGDFDYTACGGTHLKNTAEVGLIKIIGREKMRGHLRVIFLTGRQAEQDYREKHRVISRLSTALTCHYQDLERSVVKLSEQNAALRREAAVLSAKVLANDLQNKAENADSINGVKIITAELDGFDPKIIKDAGFFITGTYRCIFMAICEDKLLITVSNQLHPDAAALARFFMEKFGGKGGGNPSSAQVGGISPEKKGEYLQTFIEILKSELKG